MSNDAVRELAEEIADQLIQEQKEPYGEPWVDDTEERQKEYADWWEARLRSALPELSGLLGELAVKTAALEWIAGQGCEFPSEPCDDETTGEEFCRSCRARKTLSSGFGRLAAELIRAAVNERTLERGAERMQREATVMDDPLPSEQTVMIGKVDAAREEKRAAADALLQAFPGLRADREGEGKTDGK